MIMTALFVYSKSEYTLESVSVSGRPAVRLHDNFWRNKPIVMKFSTQYYPMNISVEFEDEHDSSRIYGFPPGISYIFDGNIDPFQFS